MYQVVLKSAEENRLVLDDGTADSKSIFVELQLGPIFAFKIAEPLVGVVDRIPVEVKHRAVKRIGAAPGGDDNVRAAIAALFGGSVQRDGPEFLHSVWIQPLDIALGVW